jgi:hypothetical protein
MRRNRYVGYLPKTQHGYLVAFDMFWTVLDSRQIDPARGAQASLLQFLEEYAQIGWIQENTPRYGCVFMHRGGVRILVEATPRDPSQRGSQTFSPFKSAS